MEKRRYSYHHSKLLISIKTATDFDKWATHAEGKLESQCQLVCWRVQFPHINIAHIYISSDRSIRPMIPWLSTRISLQMLATSLCLPNVCSQMFTDLDMPPQYSSVSGCHKSFRYNVRDSGSRSLCRDGSKSPPRDMVQMHTHQCDATKRNITTIYVLTHCSLEKPCRASSIQPLIQLKDFSLNVGLSSTLT